jgi:hypothetical protein
MLRDGVLSAWAQSIYRRPSLGWVFATRQNLRSDMLYWTRIHTVFEHTRRKERQEENSCTTDDTDSTDGIDPCHP